MSPNTESFSMRSRHRTRGISYGGIVHETYIHPEGDWAEYYRLTARRMPSRWFKAAVEPADLNHGRGRTVVDLGCGNGVETKAFLDRGWTVFAHDREPEAFEFTRARATEEELERLTMEVSPFSEIELPPADLVFAQLSLPFCSPDEFPHLWEQIRTAVKPGGFFAGQFFGPNDDWAGGACLSHSVHDIEMLLDEWAILDLDEEEHEGVAGAHREPKYWHIISVIARRP